jgi:hypothetical protein
MIVFKRNKSGIIPYKIEKRSLGFSFRGYRGFALVGCDELLYFLYPKIKMPLHSRHTFQARNTLQNRRRYVSSLSRQISLYTIWPFKCVNDGNS